VVTATGDTLVLTRSDDGGPILAAAVSLGCLGVISQVRLKVRAAYRLRDVRRTLRSTNVWRGSTRQPPPIVILSSSGFPTRTWALTKTLRPSGCRGLGPQGQIACLDHET